MLQNVDVDDLLRAVKGKWPGSARHKGSLWREHAVADILAQRCVSWEGPSFSNPAWHQTYWHGLQGL